MTNIADIKDEAALRWLKWLGATIVDRTFEHGGHTFTQFVIAGSQARCQQA